MYAPIDLVDQHLTSVTSDNLETIAFRWAEELAIVVGDSPQEIIDLVRETSDLLDPEYLDPLFLGEKSPSDLFDQLTDHYYSVS